MKKYLFSLIALFCCMSMSAQKILVYQDGQIYKSFSASEVDSIVYTTTSNNGGGEAGDDDAANSWTIMFYSVGGAGTSLDSAQVKNISQAMKSTANPNVNMTFLFKFSKAFQSQRPENQQGTFFFDMAKAREELGSETIDEDGGNWMAKISTEKIGDASYPMYTAANLTAFINKSMELHPAKHYMLILSDHGSSWNLKTDNVAKGKGSSITGIIADDCVSADGIELSTASTINGIAGSKVSTFDIIYDDACLMSMAENLFQYSKVSNYFLGAVELTPGLGGNYTQLLNLIAANPSDTYSWGKSYVDFCTSKQWWGLSGQDNADLGIYDLGKLCASNGDVVSSIKSFKDQLIKDYSGDKQTSIGIAVCSAQMNNDAGETAADFPTDLITDFTWTTAGKANCKEVRNCYSTKKESFITAFKKNYQKMWTGMQSISLNGVSTGLIMADFMKQCSNSLGGEYTTCFNKYVNAIKDCAYIKSAWKVYDGDTDKDYAYTNLSMSVNVLSLNEKGLASRETSGWLNTEQTDLALGNESPWAGNETAANLEAAYKENNKFNDLTGWVDFLKVLEVNPGVFYNAYPSENSK